jgi:signal peptidase II
MRTEDREIPVAKTVAEAPTSSDGKRRISSATSGKAYFRRFIVFACLAASGLIIDLWSKWTVFDQLRYPGTHQVWKGSVLGMSVDFQLATAFNRGALWGVGQGQTWLFASFSVVAIIAIAYFVWTRQAISGAWLTVASGLLLAGTLGNLYDRLGLHGWKDEHGLPVYAVRDFLDFVFFDSFHWATFNCADTFLVTGAIMLILHSFWTPVEQASPSLAPAMHAPKPV